MYGKKPKADYETYLHRIGRAGRFGFKGIAVTLFDNDDDEKLFRDIISHYKMEDMVNVLESPNLIKDELEKLNLKL